MDWEIASINVVKFVNSDKTLSFRQQNLLKTSQRQRMEMYMYGKKMDDVFKNTRGQVK